MVAAMACKKEQRCTPGLQESEAKSGESNKIPKTMHAHIWEAHESSRKRLESCLPKGHEDHIAGNGYNSMTRYNVVQTFTPVPQGMKITDEKPAVDKEWKKPETIPAWQLDKVKSKKELILYAQRDKKKVHLATFTDISHLKNAEVEPKLQKFQGRVVLRGDIVKDNSGACAVFTEQGSSASQTTAAKVMKVIARPPYCDGQVADAVSAYAQLKMEDAPRLLKIPKSDCPDIWIRLPRQKMAHIVAKH